MVAPRRTAEIIIHGWAQRQPGEGPIATKSTRSGIAGFRKPLSSTSSWRLFKTYGRRSSNTPFLPEWIGNGVNGCSATSPTKKQIATVTETNRRFLAIDRVARCPAGLGPNIARPRADDDQEPRSSFATNRRNLVPWGALAPCFGIVRRPAGGAAATLSPHTRRGCLRRQFLVLSMGPTKPNGYCRVPGIWRYRRPRFGHVGVPCRSRVAFEARMERQYADTFRRQFQRA